MKLTNNIQSKQLMLRHNVNIMGSSFTWLAEAAYQIDCGNSNESYNLDKLE